MTKKTWTLADLERDVYVDQITLGPDQVEGPASGYSVTKRSLQAGLRHAVDVIEVNNGTFRFVVVPTRGMGIWKASCGEVQLGWKSPVKGPVHPAFVRLDEPGGLGWLDGFDELLCRCGLESNGAPEFNENGTLKYGLHGKIANVPAHKVEVTIDGSSGEIAVTGVVDEARLFGNKLRMVSTITTEVGRPGLTVSDEIINISAEPGELELLYHVNFGTPLLDPGSKLVVPAAKLAPRDAAAMGNLAEWDTYGPETPGSVEAVFFFDLSADADGMTQALLHNAAADQGVSLKFNKSQLPCFTQWKNRQAEPDGYVTGLEPAINFPNVKSFEKQQGRVAVLSPGESRRFQITLQVHPDAASVAAAERAVAALQAGTTPQVLDQPDPEWSARCRVDRLLRLLAPSGPFLPHLLQQRRMLRLAGQVVGLVGVGLQVVKLFVGHFGVEVANVLVLLGADRFAAGNPIGGELMLVKELAPPRHCLALHKRQEALALHALGQLDAGHCQDGGGQVDAQRHLLDPAGAEPGRQPRVIDHQRHADRQLVGQPLPGEAPFAQVEAVVGRVDDDRVPVQPPLAELLDDPPHLEVHAGDQPVMVLDHRLIHLRRGKAAVPADPVKRPAEELGLGLEERRGPQLRRRDGDFGVQRLQLGIGDELARVAVLYVRGLETEGKAERPIRGHAVEKLHRLVAHQSGQMNRLPVDLVFVLVLPRPAAIVVEQFCGRLAHAPLADEPDIVARPLQQRRIDPRQLIRRQAVAEAPVVVPGGILPGDDARAVGHTDRGRHEGVVEHHALLGQAVDVGRVDDPVAHAAERVPALIVGQQKDDVGGFRLGSFAASGEGCQDDRPG